MLALLYGTGIRASECASLRNGGVDLTQLTITVQGKGGHERAIAIEPRTRPVLRNYAQVRGPAIPVAPSLSLAFRADAVAWQHLRTRTHMGSA